MSTDLDSKLVEHYTAKWKNHRAELSEDKLNDICELYMSKILKIDDKTIEKFISSFGREASHDVGMKQCAIPQEYERLEEFWLGIKNIMPKDYTELDVSWLSHVGGLFAVLDFVLGLPCKLVRELEGNGMRYR